MFYTSSTLKNIYRNCMSNQNLKWIQGILRFLDFLQPNFWDTNFYKKVVFESTDMKLDIGINKSTDGFIFNVNNWQMALVIAWNLSPNFSLSHEYTHCTLRIHSIHARVQNMKNCESVFVWVWQTSKVLQNWLTWNTNNPNKQEGEGRMMIYDFY